MAVNFSRAKKAVFFTLIALLVISLLVLSYKSVANYTKINKVSVVEGRIYSSNDFVKNMQESYIDNAIEVSLKNALHSYSDYLVTNGFVVNEATMKSNIITLMTVGKLGTITNSNNLTYLLDSIKNEANESLRLDMNYSYKVIEIFQNTSTGPWYVGVRTQVNLSVDSDVSSWNTSKEYLTYVSIENVMDPYHALNTKSAGSYINRKIKAHNYNVWDEINFQSFVDNGYYDYDANGTSFFSRLRNDTSESLCCGIASFVGDNPLYELGGPLGGYRNVSFIDYCYFDPSSLTAVSRNGTCYHQWYFDDLSSDYDAPANFDYPFTIGPAHYNRYNLTVNFGEPKAR